ncbi:hypothetical protein BS78_06G009200 [Paspalum vaginatum]|nr:hypothetical protein BS78_06G009200 [Paspalum vaginatum]
MLSVLVPLGHQRLDLRRPPAVVPEAKIPPGLRLQSRHGSGEAALDVRVDLQLLSMMVLRFSVKSCEAIILSLVTLILHLRLKTSNPPRHCPVMTDEVLSVEFGPDAAVQVCDINFKICVGSCWKSGNCMRCCKHHSFVHGRCSLKHGDGCYCCHTPDQK